MIAVCRCGVEAARQRRRARAVAASILFAAALCLTGGAPIRAGAEPPPQAPAHGHRAKAGDGTDLVYDGVFGAYAIPKQRGTYWSGDRFFRYTDGLWLSASALAGPWELIAAAQVPVSLKEAFPPPKERVRTTLPSGLAVVYQPSLRVFTVSGQPDLYLCEGRFVRYLNGVWLISASHEGPWELSPMKGLPMLLQRKVKPPEPGARVSLPSGPVLEYDGDLALFRVAGKTDAYFYNGLFFERRDAKWFESVRTDSDFEEITATKVPSALRSYYRRKDAAASAAKTKADKAAGGGEVTKKSEAAKKGAAGKSGDSDARPAAGKKAGAGHKAPGAGGKAAKTAHDKTDHSERQE